MWKKNKPIGTGNFAQKSRFLRGPGTLGGALRSNARLGAKIAVNGLLRWMVRPWPGPFNRSLIREVVEWESRWLFDVVWTIYTPTYPPLPGEMIQFDYFFYGFTPPSRNFSSLEGWLCFLGNRWETVRRQTHGLFCVRGEKLQKTQSRIHMQFDAFWG